MVWATPDEPDPAAVDLAPGTRPHWRYVGKPATQYWRVPDPDPKLTVQVNGRYTYWASRGKPIPGGIAFENFEMVSPFRDGAEFVFGVIPGLLARHAP
jgi:hypothetical protein